MKVLFGRSRGAVADARRAFACEPSDTSLYHLVALLLPPEERLDVLRHGLAKAEDEPHRLLLRSAVAQALWDSREYVACVKELEALVSEAQPETDLLGTTRTLLCWAYEALGEYGKAEATYQELLALHARQAAAIAGETVPHEVPAAYEELRRVAPDLDELLSHTRLSAIAGVVRSRMRCNDFSGALEATEQWHAFLPAERVPINVAVLEVLAGRSPADIAPLLQPVAACAAHDHYYCFFAGVLHAHAGAGREAIRYLRRFLRASSSRARIWGAQEQWERTRASELIEELRRK
jgi:tetratricopeptide (TPR) repeat protein